MAAWQKYLKKKKSEKANEQQRRGDEKVMA